MAKILVLYFSRADENYYPNSIHAVAEGNTGRLYILASRAKTLAFR